MTTADIHFHFDPVCPFAWITSRWVHEVIDQRDYSVDWRFISLRILNKDVDYEARFPPGYEAGHHAGLRLLRVAAKARAEHGPDAMAGLYTAMGESIFDIAAPMDPQAHRDFLASVEHAEAVLAAAGLPAGLADALNDESFDAEIEAQTEDALDRTGRDVGTPIIHFEPPDGVAFFGPVISRVPRGPEAVRLWDHVIELARFPGFAELKRSLREPPRLRALQAESGESASEEDWHQGSRRLQK